MLHKAGAYVSDGNLVKITAAMVEEPSQPSPAASSCATATGAPTVFLEGTKVNSAPGRTA